MSRVRARNDGHILLATMALILIFAILGLTALYMAAQDVPGVAAVRDEQTAQQLGEAAADLVISWFHDDRAVPPAVSPKLAKRFGDVSTGPTYFDAAGRSQFVGTPDAPDVLLDAGNQADQDTLNRPPSGFSGALRSLGRFTQVKIYKPTRPGLLSTVEATAVTEGRRPTARTVSFQLGTLAIPAIRSPLQVGQSLGAPQQGSEAQVKTHWGAQRIGGSLVLQRLDDVVAKSSTAPVTGLPYDKSEPLQDRWAEYWIGGQLSMTSPSSGQGPNPVPPLNVHVLQAPVPGIRFDDWPYETVKQIALRHGLYYRLDRQGRLHMSASLESDPGLAPSEALKSSAVGDRRGLIFIDTTDGQAPRADNLGTLVLDTDYLEAMLAVQGHVILRPGGIGRSIAVLSPPPEGTTSLGARIPVQLSNINLNGMLWAAGAVTIERPMRMFGALCTPQTIGTSGQGSNLEIWYDANLGRGLFRGVPLVYRAAGTWSIK